MFTFCLMSCCACALYCCPVLSCYLSAWDSEKRNFDSFVCIAHVKELTNKTDFDFDFDFEWLNPMIVESG